MFPTIIYNFWAGNVNRFPARAKKDAPLAGHKKMPRVRDIRKRELRLKVAQIVTGVRIYMFFRPKRRKRIATDAGAH